MFVLSAKCSTTIPFSPPRSSPWLPLPSHSPFASFPFPFWPHVTSPSPTFHVLSYPSPSCLFPSTSCHSNLLILLLMPLSFISFFAFHPFLLLYPPPSLQSLGISHFFSLLVASHPPFSFFLLPYCPSLPPWPGSDL